MLNETCCFKTRLNGPVLDDIIKLGEAIRRLDDVGLREAASTRTLVSDRKSCAGSTVAAVCAIASPLSDDEDTRERLTVLIESYL